MQGSVRRPISPHPDTGSVALTRGTIVSQRDSAPVAEAHRILENPTRRRLYDHLLVLPGDHFRGIARSLHVGLGTATHHLEVLVHGGLVYDRKEAGRSRFYVAGDQAQLDRNELFEKHWGFRMLRRRIWAALGRLEETTASRIASVLGITRQLAAYHLGRLELEGLVSRVHGRYRLTKPPAAPVDVTEETKRSP